EDGLFRPGEVKAGLEAAPAAEGVARAEKLKTHAIRDSLYPRRPRAFNPRRVGSLRLRTPGRYTGKPPVAPRVHPSFLYAAIVRSAMRHWCTSSAPSAKRAQRACSAMRASGVSSE